MRVLLDYYRRVQFFVWGRKRFGVMQPGISVHVEPFCLEETHGDIVHPCVRYIPQGFEGHNWWMVYTPYYRANSSMENPILCYSESNDPNIPPTEWKHYCLVNEKPTNGYNSDPSLLYCDGQLYVFWRENYVSNNGGNNPYPRATFAAKVSNGVVQKCTEPILVASDEEEDPETCPTFMLDSNGTVMAYGMHLRFHSKRIKTMKPKIKKLVNSLVSITDLVGFYSQQKHFGLAIWKQQDGLFHRFCYEKTVRFSNCNKLYRPWHMDFFDYGNHRFAIVQTNQNNADICLAWSDDEEHFTFYKTPVLTNASICKVGIYKPCAGVTPNDTFYLYYTAQDPTCRSLNKLYLTQMRFDRLIAAIR